MFNLGTILHRFIVHRLCQQQLIIMKAGQTDLEVGTRVQLQNMKGEDKELNGLVGTVTHPFAFGETKKGWVGIRLEGGKANMPYGGQCNVRVSECKVL